MHTKIRSGETKYGEPFFLFIKESGWRNMLPTHEKPKYTYIYLHLIIFYK